MSSALRSANHPHPQLIFHEDINDNTSLGNGLKAACFFLSSVVDPLTEGHPFDLVPTIGAWARQTIWRLHGMQRRGKRPEVNIAIDISPAVRFEPEDAVAERATFQTACREVTMSLGRAWRRRHRPGNDTVQRSVGVLRVYL